MNITLCYWQRITLRRYDLTLAFDVFLYLFSIFPFCIYAKIQGKPNRYEQDKILLTNLLKEQHLNHKSKGYRYLAQLVRNETVWVFSNNLAYKCCKYAHIRSKTGRGRSNKGEEHKQFPNVINGNWNTKRPMEIVVSDMTAIKHRGIKWEWVYMLDTFNNQIIASALTKKKGDPIPYYKCLETLMEKTKEQAYPVILHTDQGSVYSSRVFTLANENYTNIIRSMSKIATPTDNAVIESLNGWIKDELYWDFDLKSVDNFPDLLMTMFIFLITLDFLTN